MTAVYMTSYEVCCSQWCQTGMSQGAITMCAQECHMHILLCLLLAIRVLGLCNIMLLINQFADICNCS